MKLLSPTTIQNAIALQCPKTGITSSLLAPELSSNPSTIEKLTHLQLELVSPYSYYDNCFAIASLAPNILESINVEILAGVFITMYSHFWLLDNHEEASIANSLLRTCSIKTLARAVSISHTFTKKNTSLLPSYSLNYETHKDSASLTDSLNNYIFIVRETLFPSVQATEKLLSEIFDSKGNKKNPTGRELTYAKQLKATKELIAESLVSLRPILKQHGFEKLGNYLAQLSVSSYLKTIGSETRAKVLTRINESKWAITHSSIIKDDSIIGICLSRLTEIAEGIETAIDLDSPFNEDISEILEHSVASVEYNAHMAKTVIATKGMTLKERIAFNKTKLLGHAEGTQFIESTTSNTIMTMADTVKEELEEVTKEALEDLWKQTESLDSYEDEDDEDDNEDLVDGIARIVGEK